MSRMSREADLVHDMFGSDSDEPPARSPRRPRSLRDLAGRSEDFVLDIFGSDSDLSDDAPGPSVPSRPPPIRRVGFAPDADVIMSDDQGAETSAKPRSLIVRVKIPKTEATRKILETPELIDLICGYLPRGSTLRFGKTCQRVLPIALRVIYRELDGNGFRSLLRGFAVAVSISLSGFGILFTNSAFLGRQAHDSALSVERFAMYSKWVKKVDFNLHLSNDRDSIARCIPAAIARGGSSPLFPSLHSLRTHLGYEGELPSLLLLFTGGIPDLEVLKVSVRFREPSSARAQDDLVILLQILPDRCPKLRRLDIRALHQECPAIEPALSQALNRLQHLEQVTLNDVNATFKTVESLAQHRNLTSITFHQKPLSTERNVSLNGLLSRRLRVLELKLDVPVLAEVLGAFPDTIEDLDVHASKAEELKDHIGAIALALKSQTGLLHADLRFYRTFGGEGDVTTMSSLLRALTFSPKLCSVVLYGENDFSPPDDGDLDRFASSCPRLETLQLIWRPSSQGPTPLALHSLGQKCPALSTIRLSQLFANDRRFICPQGSIQSHAVALSIHDLDATELDALAAVLAGGWSSVKLYAGADTEAILQGVRAIRRYQASQSRQTDWVFDPDADSVLLTR